MSDKAHARHERIVALKQAGEGSQLELAKELYEFQHDETRPWTLLDYATLEAYLAQPELDIGRTSFFRLTQVHKTFRIDLKVPTSGLSRIGIPKLSEIVGLVGTPAKAEEWLAKAETLTFRDLRKEIARVRHADGKTLAELVRKCANKTDQERFEILGWGLRTYDLWNFNACDERFGMDWPGRIPAQLVAHALFFFTKENATVVDPMAGGGVVPDVCSVFRRDCLAFDMDPAREGIKPHYFDPGHAEWPTPRKADMIFWDAPYFAKMAKKYGPGLSSLDRKHYLAAIGEILGLAIAHLHRGGVLAFLNSDWRAFESTRALDEDASLAVTMFDYARLIEGCGFTITHRIECPMSNARFSAGVVSAMQESRILGTVNRTLLVARV